MSGTEPFTLIQGTEDLNKLVEKLKRDLPVTSYMYNSALIHAKEFADSYSYYVLEKYPESDIILWKNKKDKMTLGIHCTNDEISLLEKILSETKLIDFKKSICIFHVPEYLLPLLQDFAKNAVGQEMSHSVGFDYIFDDSQATKPLECPAGFKVCRLGKAGVQHMYNNWRYKIAVPVEEVLHITKNVPCVGIYEDPEQKETYIVDLANLPAGDDEKIPVSWISACLHGPQGMQMTEEAFRRRGFASLLAQVCAKMMIQQGFFPHTNVEEDLMDLEQLYEKLPGWSYNQGLAWVWHMIDEHGKVKKCH